MRPLRPRLGGLSDAEIHHALEQERSAGFEQTRLHARIFELAELAELAEQTGLAETRAVLPKIELRRLKITRPLTTEWFARRVEKHWTRCLERAGQGQLSRWALAAV